MTNSNNLFVSQIITNLFTRKLYSAASLPAKRKGDNIILHYPKILGYFGSVVGMVLALFLVYLVYLGKLPVDNTYFTQIFVIILVVGSVINAIQISLSKYVISPEHITSTSIIGRKTTIKFDEINKIRFQKSELRINTKQDGISIGLGYVGLHEFLKLLKDKYSPEVYKDTFDRIQNFYDEKTSLQGIEI